MQRRRKTLVGTGLREDIAKHFWVPQRAIGGHETAETLAADNRAGAGGNVAAAAVLSSEADGYTVYIASIGHAISQFTTPSLTVLT